MGAAGLGVVIGWCVVWYAALGNARGRLAAFGVLITGMLGAHLADDAVAAFTLLAAATLAAFAHIFLRRLLSRAKGV